VKRTPRTAQAPKDLRWRAEEARAGKRRDLEPMPERDLPKLVHDLQVHQIELEMQNDELRRTQEALEEARDRFADLYDFAPLALLTLSPAGEVLEANLAAARLLGLDRKDLLHQKFSRFIPAEARDAFYLCCHQVLHAGIKQTAELTLKTAGGGVLTVRLEGIAADDPVTHATNCRLSLSDITELVQYRSHLQELVAQRTRELEAANKQLRMEIAARKVAEEALLRVAEDLKRSNLDLEQFGYAASHDLQEPLRAVAGYVKLLEHRFPEKLDAKMREYIAGAAEGAIRMERLITDLLSYSRVGTEGRGFAPANLQTVLNSVLHTLQFRIRAAHATVTSDPLPTLEVDEGQIAQLFQNLIGNALKFHGERPPQLHVGARPEAGRWVFWVRDNGIGIEPQHFERIFQVFQRLHTRNKYPGTGIGLAICKKIVERHGGAMWVESKPGAGSTFFFSLPDPQRGESASSSMRPAKPDASKANSLWGRA
jgi:PAS domain S-box-containing protein